MDPDMQNKTFRTPVETIYYPSGVEGSVWGTEIPEVCKVIQSIQVTGNWVNLCAGDGRYNQSLAEKVDQIFAIDLDQAGLLRLLQREPSKNQGKIKTIVHDILSGLPFENQSMDGVLCNGSLHLFNPNQVSNICREILRILRPQGEVIVDFSYDIQRILPNASSLQYPHEHIYSEEEAISIFMNEWGEHNVNVIKGAAPPMVVSLGEITYTYSSKGLLFHMIKLNKN